MLLINYLILSIVQGFTEPLPISSSGHLKIMKTLLTNKAINDINFEIIVNFGSLIAIVILYKNEIFEIIRDFFMFIINKNEKYKTNFKYTWLIIFGTIPAAIFGMFIKEIIESKFTTKLVGLMLIITAIILFLIRNKEGNKNKKDITFSDALKIGLFQVLALFPGISRSGSTVACAMNCNFRRETALNFSFMLYIPISIASFILGIKDLIQSNDFTNLLIPYFVSLVMSSIITYYSAKLFINIMKKGKLIYFSIYCFIVGILTFLIF